MRFLIIFVGLPLSVAAGVLAWHIGENITPEVLRDITMVFGFLGGGTIGLLLLFVVMRLTNGDRANERMHTTARQRNGSQHQLPPVVVISSQPQRIGSQQPAGFISYNADHEVRR